MDETPSQHPILFRVTPRRPKGGQLSLRGVATELAARGFLNERGKRYAAKSVASMLKRGDGTTQRHPRSSASQGMGLRDGTMHQWQLTIFFLGLRARGLNLV
jgi:hypothetical protein